MKKYIGFDLGASSGRVFIGSLEENVLNLDEVYRFHNGGIPIFNSLYWNILRLFEEIRIGLKKCVDRFGSQFNGIGINTWGVDFVLLDKNDELIGLNYHYRDKRTDGMLEEMFKVVPKEEIFKQTGIQSMQINSSTQLFSMVKNKSPQLSIAKTFLMIADYFNFLLSGRKCSEYSLASTSQLYNPTTQEWAFDLIKKLGFNPNWFPEILSPGTILGNIHDTIVNQTGIEKNTPIIATLCHDTASAIAAIPLEEGIQNWAYLSSGTWSLIGLEMNKPLINNKVLKYNLTNEGGAFGTIRFLKNITGLWIIQECKNLWEEMNNLTISFDEIELLAKKAQPFTSYLFTDNTKFLNPNNMIEAIQNYCKKTNQEVPIDIGAISRIIFESLAFRYKQILDEFQEFSEKKIEKLYVVGGGSQNDLLCQFTSNITNLPVDAGPTEATVIGNILMQAVATNEIHSLQELRQIVRNSFEIKSFKPRNVYEWEEAYRIYLKYYEMQKNNLIY